MKLSDKEQVVHTGTNQTLTIKVVDENWRGLKMLPHLAMQVNDSVFFDLESVEQAIATARKKLMVPK